MGITHQTQAGDLIYTVVDDCTTSFWAVITGSVTDEILGGFYAADFRISQTDLGTKTTPNGLYALTGYPDQLFPQLAITSYPMNFVLQATGFRDFNISMSVPVAATFPVLAPTAAMRRLPVRIQGRVVSNISRAPIANALVLSVDDPLSPPPAVHTTALRSPLYFAHGAGASAQFVSIGVGTPNKLDSDALGGSQVLNMHTLSGTGSVIQLSSPGQVNLEYGLIDHVGPGAPGACQVFLKNPLNRTYPAASTVANLTDATPTGTPTSLSTDANAGDGVLRAPVLLNAPTGGTVVIDLGAAGEEYHEVGAVSDVDGYYGLDGMGRVPEIFLNASQGALKQEVSWFIEYDNAINLVDFRLS